MITLRFKEDHAWRHEIGRADPMKCGAAQFRHNLFFAPVLLQIDNTILLDWIPAPLYWMGAAGIHVVGNLPKSRTGSLMIPGTSYLLTFSAANGEVQVDERLAAVRATVRFDDLLATWRSFANDVRAALLHQFPGLVDHPNVGSWFRGE